MPLTDIEIRQTRPGTAPLRLNDDAGMFLLLNPNGTRYWRFRYRINGKEKMVSLGVYPEVTLKLARERRDKYRRQICNDPVKTCSSVNLRGTTDGYIDGRRDQAVDSPA